MDISINKFLAQLRREPNPDDVLDWVYARLNHALVGRGDRFDAILDAIGMIEAYQDALIALA